MRVVAFFSLLQLGTEPTDFSSASEIFRWNGGGRPSSCLQNDKSLSREHFARTQCAENRRSRNSKGGRLESHKVPLLPERGESLASLEWRREQCWKFCTWLFRRAPPMPRRAGLEPLGSVASLTGARDFPPNVAMSKRRGICSSSATLDLLPRRPGHAWMSTFHFNLLETEEKAHP